MIEVRLRPGVEKKIKAYFQWVYNLEIEEIKGNPAAGRPGKGTGLKKEIFRLRIHKPKHQDNGQISLFQRR
jgi:hypothetical protein